MGAAYKDDRDPTSDLPDQLRDLDSFEKIEKRTSAGCSGLTGLLESRVDFVLR